MKLPGTEYVSFAEKGIPKCAIHGKLDDVEEITREGEDVQIACPQCLVLERGAVTYTAKVAKAPDDCAGEACDDYGHNECLECHKLYCNSCIWGNNVCVECAGRSEPIMDDDTEDTELIPIGDGSSQVYAVSTEDDPIDQDLLDTVAVTDDKLYVTTHGWGERD